MAHREIAAESSRWAIPLETVLGPALLEGNGHAISAFGWVDQEEPQPKGFGIPNSDAASVCEALHAYLSGDAWGWTHLRRIPLHLSGTAFQNAVWAALREIPFGKTWSYGAMAKVLGHSAASARAVGAACARNPVALIIPCHRVLDASGTLTGFKWGLARKRALLALEQSSQIDLFP